MIIMEQSPEAPSPSTPQPTPPAAAPSSRGPGAELNESEAATMASWIQADVSSGKMSEAQAKAALADLGREFTPPQNDTKSDQAKALDKAFPIASPESFLINWGAEELTSEEKDFDGKARGWLAGATFDRDTGNSLVKAVDRVLRHTERMTPGQLEEFGYTEFEKLQRAHGPALEERLKLAGKMISELDSKSGGLKDFIRRVGDDSLVANALINQARVYFGRKTP